MTTDDFAPIEAKQLPLRKAGRSWAACHAILGVASLGLAHLLFPRFEAILKDFGAPLPAVTLAAIKASHFTIKYFYLIVVPLTAALLCLDLVALDRLSAGKDGPACVRAWGLGLTLLLVVLLVGSLGAMVLPMVTILTKLSG
jgi:hypothetical protein